MLVVLSDAARASGAWDEAARYAEEAFELATQTGRLSLEPQCLICAGRMAMLGGDLALAREKVEEALACLDQLSSPDPPSGDEQITEVDARSLLGRIAALAGDHAEAHEWFCAAAPV